MTPKAKPDKLIRYIADLREEDALREIRDRLAAGQDVLSILKTCQEGLRTVGRRYESGEYYISGLIMGGEILKLALEEMRPALEVGVSKEKLGTLVIGTVEGDIHDIGKNIVSTVLSCHGFKVIDLGVDVPPEIFVETVHKHKPSILGLSCLMTTAVESMRKTILELEKAGLRKDTSIIIGGSILNNDACATSGADYWTSDVMEGVGWCIRKTAFK